MNLKPFHNTWRAMKYTYKGKKVGCEWVYFADFYNDMFPTYADGLKICRIDKNKPFSKENCKWAASKDLSKHRLTKLEYNNQIKTIREWCDEYNLNAAAVMQRRFKGKNYTSEEILFGKIKRPRRELLNEKELSYQKQRDNASKKIAQYKCRDRKRGLPDYILTIEWFINNILLKNCTYCGKESNIGADRIDNNKGHEVDNIVPCCYRCNAVRQNFFTFDEMKKIGAFIRENIDKKDGKLKDFFLNVVTIT
jgi:hypothetical protein